MHERLRDARQSYLVCTRSTSPRLPQPFMTCGSMSHAEDERREVGSRCRRGACAAPASSAGPVAVAARLLCQRTGDCNGVEVGFEVLQVEGKVEDVGVRDGRLCAQQPSRRQVLRSTGRRTLYLVSVACTAYMPACCVRLSGSGCKTEARGREPLQPDSPLLRGTPQPGPR